MECLRVNTTYLSTKLEGGGDAKTSIRNGKIFDLGWPESVRPTPEVTKAMLQAEYVMRAKGVKKLRTNLSTSYGLVLCQCTDYLQSWLEVKEKWERSSNERDLLKLQKSVKSLSHKYDEDTEYHHIAYHTLLRRFMLFRQGDYSNLEYKKIFKEKIEVLEAY